MESVLKIVMIGSLPVDIVSVKGGVEAVIMNLLDGFNQIEEIKVTHISFNKDIKKTTVTRLGDNIKIIFIPFKIKYDVPDYFLNSNTLKNILTEEKPNLIHIQEITPQILRFFNYSREKIVITQHGIMKEEIKYAEGLKKLKGLFKLMVERFYYPGFQNLIFISNYNRNLFSGNISKSVNIFNPVNEIFFGETVRTENANSLMYVGVINKRKNLRLVLEAISALKKRGIIFHLHVVGGFKDKDYEIEINKFIQEHRISEQITLYGWLEQKEILKVYGHCSYFVLPSQQETLPVSIGEAMALGKVVIASDVGAISEMFKDKVSGFLFRKDSLEDLTQILEDLAKNPGSIEAISLNAKDEALKKFHPLTVAEETLRFYREVLQS